MQNDVNRQYLVLKNWIPDMLSHHLSFLFQYHLLMFASDELESGLLVARRTDHALLCSMRAEND
jgi:hypothetical protein